MAKIRVGLIGLGSHKNSLAPGAWGALAHLAPLRDLPEYEIVALANSSVESAQKSIAFHGLPAGTKAYGSPEDLARDPDVDLVVVSVNVGKHFELAKPALENKKDIFVEWPLGASLEESEELTRLAQANGVKAIVGVQARASPVVLKLKELVASGKIGRVVSSTVIGHTSAFPHDTWITGAEYYLDFKSGGNEYHILFGHFFDSFIHVLGEFSDVQGLLKTQYPTTALVDMATGKVVDPAYPRTSPDQILVQGSLASGAVASIAFRKAGASADDQGLRWIISGSDGEIELTTGSGFWQYGGVDQWSLRVKVGKGEMEKIDLLTLDSSPAAAIPEPATNTARVYQSFAKGAGLEATFESATKTHRLLDKIAKSSGW